MPIVWSPSCPEGVSFICFSGCAFKLHSKGGRATRSPTVG